MLATTIDLEEDLLAAFAVGGPSGLLDDEAAALEVREDAAQGGVG